MSENVVTPGPVARKVESYEANVTTYAATLSQEPLSTGGSPFLMILGGLVGIAIIAIGGLYIRRWWFWRQNPVLFRKYD